MLLDDVKTALRISGSQKAFDGEIQDLIDAARSDLKIAGVAKIFADADGEKLDPLIKRAVIVYCKANFGFSNPDADRLSIAFDKVKNQITSSGDYYVIS
jgi:uncharacterized phage protein (predicted DNA packaging)